jgi:hypothetical protein
LGLAWAVWQPNPINKAKQVTLQASHRPRFSASGQALTEVRELDAAPIAQSFWIVRLLKLETGTTTNISSISATSLGIGGYPSIAQPKPHTAISAPPSQQLR